MSIQLIPGPGSNGHGGRPSWAVMEARLRTAQAHGQLIALVAQLDRLDGIDELDPTVREALSAARRELGEGLAALATARRELDTTVVPPPPPPPV